MQVGFRLNEEKDKDIINLIKNLIFTGYAENKTDAIKKLIRHNQQDFIKNKNYVENKKDDENIADFNKVNVKNEVKDTNKSNNNVLNNLINNF